MVGRVRKFFEISDRLVFLRKHPYEAARLPDMSIFLAKTHRVFMTRFSDVFQFILMACS